MTPFDYLVALLLYLVFAIGAVAGLALIAKAKCWQRINRNVLLARAAERYKAIGP